VIAEKAINTHEKVRDFQNRLYLTAKADRKRKFYVLYDKIYRNDILEEAWKRVKQNGGAGGVDKVSIEDVKAYGEDRLLCEIAEELRTEKYRCKPVRRTYIPKPDGRKRALGIPTIKDRIVQMAAKIVIEPVFEADFQSCSYGFRPKRNAKQAIDKIYEVAYMADQLLSMHHDEELDRGDLSAFGFPFMALRYMADDFLRENECEKEPFDTEHYHKFYESSNIVRIRDKDRSLTILGGQEAFLKFQKGHNYTILRIAASYFGPKGRFLPKLEKTESGYRLSYECEWGYVRPLGKVKGSLKDGKIDWEFREKVHTMTWTMTVDVSYEDGEVKLQTESSNINRLPFKIDLLFPAEGTLEHDSFSVKGTKGSYMIVKKGSFEYRYQDDRITVEGAFGEHEYTKEMRGAPPMEEKRFTVNFTGFSPAKKTIRIR
jgi:hypothetical protein